MIYIAHNHAHEEASSQCLGLVDDMDRIDRTEGETTMQRKDTEESGNKH